MPKLESMRAVASTSDDLSRTPELKDLKLGNLQQARIQRLIDSRGEPILWESENSLERRVRLAVVTKPLTGPAVDLLCRALERDSVVVIPFAENPVFDFLKSKLHGYGTVAPSGADGPHQLWWGGPDDSGFQEATHAQWPLVVSSYPNDSDRKDLDRLVKSVGALGLDHAIEPAATTTERVTGAQKVKFILDTWEKTTRPVLWVDADAVFTQMPSLLATSECDIAVHKWRGWELATRTLYFGRSIAAEALLRTWLHLAESFPAVWEGHLLDQAWSLVTSQMPLRTFWLPRTYHASNEDCMRETAVIAHNISAAPTELAPWQDYPNALRTARRAGRTGAPEPQLVMTSPSGRHGTIVVLIRDVQSADAHAIASSVETIASAFARDPGGFNQLELSLCRWHQDVRATLAVAERAGARACIIDPAETIGEDIFQDIGRRIDAFASDRVFHRPPREVEKGRYRRPNLSVMHGRADAGECFQAEG